MRYKEGEAFLPEPVDVNIPSYPCRLADADSD